MNEWKYLVYASQHTPIWLFFKKEKSERFKEHYWFVQIQERTLLQQSPSKPLSAAPTLDVQDSYHIKYMWHSLTHFSRKLWIWSFGCSLLTPGKASHKYFLFSFKPSNAWFSSSILNHCIYFQLERQNISCWNQGKWMLNGVWWDLGRVCSIFLLILTLLKKYFQFWAYF